MNNSNLNAQLAAAMNYQQWQQRYNFELLRYRLLLEGRHGSSIQPQPYQFQRQVRFMTPAERAPYSDIAANQRERLGLEMPTSGVIISTAESTGVRKRKRAIKDPNAPKRATTAFFFFAQEERPKVREINPEFKVTDVSKKLGEMWRQMDAKEKQRFQDLALKDRQRYHDEMKIFNEKANGNGPQQQQPTQGSEAAVAEPVA